MLGGNRGLYTAPRRRNRLDSGDKRPHDGLEDRILSREIVLPLQAPRNGGTRPPFLYVFLWAERLLPWRTPHLGTVSNRISGQEAPLCHRVSRLRTWLFLGVY